MQSTVARIKEYIDYKGISVRKFEELNGFSNGSFASQFKNNKTIGVDKVENILHNFKDINPIWLLTGVGAMEITEKQPVNKSCEEIIDSYKAMLDSYKQMAEMQLKQIQLLQTHLQESNQMVTFSKIEGKEGK